MYIYVYTYLHDMRGYLEEVGWGAESRTRLRGYSTPPFESILSRSVFPRTCAPDPPFQSIRAQQSSSPGLPFVPKLTDLFNGPSRAIFE